MDTPVTFSADHTPSTLLGWEQEWAVAWQNAEGNWVRGEMTSEDAARREAELRPGAVVISREVSGWCDSPVYEPRAEYDGVMDALVAQIIDEENAVVRAGLLRGADIAVTHMHSPSQRMAHRISCLSLRDGFDRTVAWPTRFRERLQENSSFRPALPTLMTRSEARAHQVSIRASEPHPIVRLSPAVRAEEHQWWCGSAPPVLPVAHYAVAMAICSLML